MFIPCDKDGNVLEEPTHASDFMGKQSYSDEYKKAKERVLFDGFELETEGQFFRIKVVNPKSNLTVTDIYNKYGFNYKTIEDLVGLDLTLTQSAINKLR